MAEGKIGPPGDVARGTVGPKARGMYHRKAREFPAGTWPIWWPFVPPRPSTWITVSDRLASALLGGPL
jgi:hypothetical protein